MFAKAVLLQYQVHCNLLTACCCSYSNAQAAIAEKGYFTLAVPGGSVLKALAGLTGAKLDWSKIHMFYVNHKVQSLFRYSTVTCSYGAHCGRWILSMSTLVLEISTHCMSLALFCQCRRPPA